jgi:hypothetical protein
VRILPRIAERRGDGLILRMAGMDHLADVGRDRLLASGLDERHEFEHTLISSAVQ